MDASVLGKVFLVGGGALVLLGVYLMLGGRLPFGRLPGDISIQGQGGSFSFPIVTCVVISVALTIVLNIVLRR